MCGKMSIFMAPAESEYRAGGDEGFARDLGGRTRPRLRVGRLVTRVAAVALGGHPGEELAEGDGAGPGRQPIGGLTGNEAAARHVAVLHVDDLFARHAVDVAGLAATADQMVGVEEQAAPRVG